MQTSKRHYNKRERREPDISTLVYGKVPPQAKDLERVVLGAIMLEKGAFDMAAAILKSNCLYVDAHVRIFEAMCSLNDRSAPIDIMTVGEELKKRGDLEIIGGPLYLAKITQDVTSAANIEAHCRIILQKYIGREIIRISGEAINAAYEDSEDEFDILDQIEGEIFQLATSHVKRDFVSMDKALVEAMKRIDILRAQDSRITGVPTGYDELDNVTRGWQPSDLIIVAARPAVGKTAFMLNLVRNAALHSVKPTPTAVFNLEMDRLQLTNRLLSAETQVPLEHISNGQISDPDLARIHSVGIQRLARAPIFIDDTAGLTMLELRAKARRLVYKHGVGLIIIDYLQLMSGDGKSQNREQEIAKISRDLKKMAKELQAPVIALSQLSRDVEKRKGEPQLSDLRESGAIEQDADMVIFLYRPPEEDVQRDPDLQDTGKVLIRKFRNGKLANIVFRVFNEIQAWMDIGQAAKYLEKRQPPSSSGYSSAMTSFRNRAANDSLEDTPF